MSVRSLLAATAVAALALASTGLGAPVASAAPGGRSEHDRIVAFWTKDRVAKAVPRDFVRDQTTGRFSLSPLKGKPSTSGVAGADWTGGGLVQKTTGKVLFAMSGAYYVCSASVVADQSAGTSLVLTAGHCVWDNEGGGFATNWMFVPDYDSHPVQLDASGNFCPETTYGCWTAQALTVPKAFADETSFSTTATLHDFAFATVGGGGATGTQQLDSVVGTQAISYAEGQPKATTDLFGYPASKKFDGARLIYSEGALGYDPYNSNNTYRVASTMTGGCSGGPWYQSFSTGTGAGATMSVNSYGYNGQKYMQGPIFNSETEALHDLADGATQNSQLVFG